MSRRDKVSGHLLRAIRVAAVAACALLAPTAQADEHPKPAAADHQQIWSRVESIGAELESLRFYMGKPVNTQPGLDVEGADAREVYYQLLATFKNAERLCFQHVREHTSMPAPAGPDLSAADSLHMADAILECLARVRRQLGVDAPTAPLQAGGDKSPTDVFCAVVQANRQLNLMLDQQVAPSDVFEQVTRAVGYTARLLEVFPDAATLPVEPEFVAGKRPADVYRRLLGCREIIQQVAAESGVSMLVLRVDDAEISRAEPSDVYHLASLVVSEVSHLHAHRPELSAPPAVYYVGRKFPSDVFQRVGLLELQLVELRAHAGRRPDWLRSGGS